MRVVGKIVKPFGQRGEVVVNFFDDFADRYDCSRPLYIVVDGLNVALFAGSVERRGVNSAVVEFDDFDSPLRSNELIGKQLLVADEPIDDDDEQDEFVMEDMIGWKVLVKGDKGLKGEIVDFYDSEVNPLFEVAFGEREVLVPAVDELVVKLDARRSTITFDLPEGLLDLNG